MKRMKVFAAAGEWPRASTHGVLAACLAGLFSFQGVGIAGAAEVRFGARAEISASADGAFSVHAADVDGDGDVDVLSAIFFEDKIAWYENKDGKGSAWTPRTISKTAHFAQAVCAADVNGDGHVDVLSAAERDDRIAWYENAAGDGSAWPAHTISTSADGARAVFAADVDGDGDVDVLSASRDDDKIAWYENEAGDGRAWKEHPISTSAKAAHSVFAADLDGDGDTDAISASEDDDKIAWYENKDGKGAAWTERAISTAADAAGSVSAADVDGDGDVDAISASGNDDKIAWYENKDGKGAAWTEHTISTAADAPFSVHAADLDGDGDVDVLSASFFDDTIAWYRNEGSPGSSPAAETKNASP